MTTDRPADVLDELPPAHAELVTRLAALPGVEAIALGGSRAQGTAGPDSDWDFGIYYRTGFDPAEVRALGYDGTVVEIGEWGGGVFNGGAWLQVDGHKTDLLWRDLDVVEHEIAEARAGRWRVEPLRFHLTGIPTYLLLAELAANRALVGRLPRPGYPEALRESAARGWARGAELTLDFARTAHARQGRVTTCFGALAVGAAEFAHAVAAASGRWVTNDKTLLSIGGMSAVDDIVRVAGRDPSPAALIAAVDATVELGRSTLAAARADR
ncbi:nucleotidyltransferase domain-containing protein [Microlunatus elymi]|uniref:Nucleotidyltransferase domain-containing protein n=1 Tax=Microlunatus elymi TaxID=2596828 RepID=A0A516PZ43_9ACTN|nr:nucleotidyltransferase domain-containing protein [Microlunatus elymi]QDP96449.1 nucleotidyltransferase domain-containing protein [Microlunatus elymi]